MNNLPLSEDSAKRSPANLLGPIGLIVTGVAVGLAGVYVGDTDDAPGAAVVGLVLMVTLVLFGARAIWRRR